MSDPSASLAHAGCATLMLNDSTAGSCSSIVTVFVHAVASVTMRVYDPAIKPDKSSDVDPLSHWKIYGLTYTETIL